MRDRLRALVYNEHNKKWGSMPDHLGLAYTRFAPIGVTGDSAGKVPDERMQDWLEKLEKISVPNGYDDAYKRWERSFLDEPDTKVFVIRFDSRLLTGHGLTSATGIGLSLQHTWGVPFIPGSAIKGLLSNYIQTVYGPQDPSQPDPERAPYQAAQWRGSSIAFGPGDVIRQLFGAPDADDKTRAQLGCVTFHDAWWIPEKKLPVARDVLTPHQRTYYGTGSPDQQKDPKSECWPNDYDDPNPVAFLSIKPLTPFLVALSGPPAWTTFAEKLIKDALTNWGIGGKTAAGYGRASLDEALTKKHVTEYKEKKEADAWAQRPALERWKDLVQTQPAATEDVLLPLLPTETEEDEAWIKRAAKELMTDLRYKSWSTLPIADELRAFGDALYGSPYLTEWLQGKNKGQRIPDKYSEKRDKLIASVKRFCTRMGYLLPEISAHSDVSKHLEAIKEEGKKQKGRVNEAVRHALKNLWPDASLLELFKYSKRHLMQSGDKKERQLHEDLSKHVKERNL